MAIKTATELPLKSTTGTRGNWKLFQLSEPLDGHSHVIVSAAVAPFSGAETYIFPATPGGEVTDYGELEGSYRGGLSHSVALENAGYKVAWMDPLPCHRCSDMPTQDGILYHDVWCDNCYDGAPDGNHEVGSGRTRDEAVSNWNAIQEMAAES